ncbi:hypothetical protein ACNKU7_03250 [Microbulbifer sp. SA54]|uniref:hypothetical protein n=1 Tax=Microbulbifer sp. SA54 TaxID=3401577 RepID=UPI003AAA2055
MALTNFRLPLALLVITALLLMLKLFTAIIMLPDDPASFLIFRFSPSLENYLSGFPAGIKYTVLLADENGVIGEPFYQLLVRYLWWLFAAVALLVVLARKPWQKG